VNPGSHTIVAMLPGTPPNEQTVTVDVIEGETKEAPIVFVIAKPEEPKKEPEKPPVTPPPVVVKPQEKPAEPPMENFLVTEPRHHRMRDESHGGTSGLAVFGWITFGVGVGVGAVTGTIAMMKANDVKGECPGTVCPQGAPSDDLQQTKNLALYSTISFAVAGGGLLLAIIGMATGKKDSSSSSGSIQPWIGIGSAGISGAF
jgi:hypothetical protein